MNTTCSFAYTGRKAAHCRQSLQVCRTLTALGPGRRQRQTLLIHDSGPRRRRQNEPSPEQLRHLTTADRLFVDSLLHCAEAVPTTVRQPAVLQLATPQCPAYAYFYYQVSVLVLLCHSITQCLCMPKLCKCAEVRNDSFVCLTASFHLSA